jgi:transposase-like protein
MPVMTADPLAELRKAAAAHKRAKTALKRARDHLDQAMTEAADNGAVLRTIEDITGLNHETVRTAITRVRASREAPAE